LSKRRAAIQSAVQCDSIVSHHHQRQTMLRLKASYASRQVRQTPSSSTGARASGRGFRHWQGPSALRAASSHHGMSTTQCVRSIHQSPQDGSRHAAWVSWPVDINAVKRLYTPTIPSRNTTVVPAIVPQIESLLLSMTDRGIDKMQRPQDSGDLLTGLDALVRARRILLCTGFNVAPGLPETDGPVGTAVLAFILWRIAKVPIIVVDEANLPPMQEAMKVLDAGFAKQVRLVQMPGTHADSAQQAYQLLRDIQPDIVVHTEVPGRNSIGIYNNMRGIDISGFNRPHDEIMNIANREGIGTIGIGDGGNEAGMGGILNVPKAQNDEEMQAVVPARHQILAWNSNLGAIALAELLAGMYFDGPGSPTERKRACSGEQLVQLIAALLKAGAVDGVTRGSILDEIKPDGKGKPAHTSVDGHPSARHVGDLKALQGLISTKLGWARDLAPKSYYDGGTSC
jgi:hypothetical protein